MRFKHLALGFLVIFIFTGSLWAQKLQYCRITSDNTPPTVNAGGTHTFTVSCPSPVWSVSGPGSIDPSTGVYTAPATVWAQDVSRGFQLLPNDNVYKLPINHLPVENRSSYWMQRVVDDGPGLQSYHTFKLLQPGLLNFYDNVVDNSAPTQLMHFYYGGPYQNTPFRIPMPPNVSMQNGWSQDTAANLDRHVFSIDTQTGDDSELYSFYMDYLTISISPGNPTSIAYTTRSIRTLQNPIRVYISGITGGCSILNGNYMATVVSQAPGVGGTLTVPVDTTGLSCSVGRPIMSGLTQACNLCNSQSGQHWFPNSNSITGGVDAAGSPLSATSVHLEEWWNVVQNNILDPACNCVTLGHAIRTTLSNAYISPRNLWPSILGNKVTWGHGNMALLAANRGTTTTFVVQTNRCGPGGTQSYLQCQLPCPGFTYTIGCQFNIVIGNYNPYTGAWAAANGNWVATAVSNATFSIPLDSTAFPALPPNGTFIFDWLPYGSHIRLKSSFNVAAFCSNNSLTDKCPYEKAILNTLQIYGLVLLDGTVPSDNWESGIVSSEFDPDQLTDATVDLKQNAAFQHIEQYLEVADASGQQIDFTPYTNLGNQIGLTANNRVTVSMTSPGYIPTSMDVMLQGTAVGTDRERIGIVTGTTYQINSWVTGNDDTTLTYAMAPTVPGASVSGSGVLTAPSSLSAVTKTTVTITSVADSTANAYVDVYFIPVSGDGAIRLNFGQHATSYTDHLGNVWWGQNQTRSFNSTYEIGGGVGFAHLNGTWNAHSSSWSGTVDAQLYAQSTSAENDTNLSIVVPNGTYTLTLYGEPGYGITAAGHNVYDVEINGVVASSYNDGFLLAGGLYRGYTSQYHATVSNGILQFNGRIREYDTAGFGMSLSSLLITTGGR
jgi:Malectin domain